jgi:DNA-binding transcriptional MerR regulator
MYRPDAVRIVRFVMRAQELGFGLREAETLLGLAAGGPESCQVARELAERRSSSSIGGSWICARCVTRLSG